MNNGKKRILLGSTFPLSLVRRDVRMRVISIAEFREVLADTDHIVSFWGHENTRRIAEGMFGVDLLPKTERPAISLSQDGLPTLDGETFSTCYVCSPDYRRGFRPAIGEEVPADAITGWQMLRIDWL